MNTTVKSVRVLISRLEPVEDLIKGINIMRCPLPTNRIVPRFPVSLEIQFVAIGRPCRDAGDLRHAMFDVLLKYRFKSVPSYVSLWFNAKYPMVQLDRPFVGGDYCFGAACHDPYGEPDGKSEGLELSTIEQFAVGGTSQYLIMLAMEPTAVDLGCLDGDILDRALSGIEDVYVGD